MPAGFVVFRGGVDEGWTIRGSKVVAQTTRFSFCMIGRGILVISAIIAAVSAGWAFVYADISIVTRWKRRIKIGVIVRPIPARDVGNRT